MALTELYVQSLICLREQTVFPSGAGRDGVVSGYIHPFLRTLRVLSDQDPIEKHHELQSRGYVCVRISFYVIEGEKPRMAYRPFSDVTRRVGNSLKILRSKLKEMDYQERTSGSISIGDEDLLAEARKQHLLFSMASFRGDGD